MIDMPPQDPPSVEQVIENRLIECGVDADGITVTDVSEHYYVDVEIRSEADAREEHISCIHEAVSGSFVRFDSQSTQTAYDDYVAELMRPQMLAEATKTLTDLGLLDNFPARDDFDSMESFIAALEVHAGAEAGAWLSVEGNLITLWPTSTADFSPIDYETAARVLSVLRYASLTEDILLFGFVGNERIAED